MKHAADLALRIVASAPGTAVAVVTLDPDFAGFAGHFPGAPVLPGMCHVDLAMRAASQVVGGPLDLLAVDRARFVRKALPGEELKMLLVFRPSAGEVTSIAADLSVGGETAAELHLVVSRRPGPPARR
jgi:3-hydroxyacyl-[acyl-carrier-protein] dehydratase